MGEWIWSRNFRSQPEGVFSYDERKRTEIANEKIQSNSRSFGVKAAKIHDKMKEKYGAEAYFSFSFAIMPKYNPHYLPKAAWF